MTFLHSYTELKIAKITKFICGDILFRILINSPGSIPEMEVTIQFSSYFYINMSESLNRPIRVLVAKVGLDGHDRGAKIIASTLRDAGMEVIYTGLRQTPEMVVNTALQEDVDAIGVSILSGAHMTVFPKIIQFMKEKGLTDVLVTGGGIIPENDMKTLHDMGVGKLFQPGTHTGDIVSYIQNWVRDNRTF
jgi:methylmalonyl-CoA mutase C-terminal domain/subunit